MDLCHNPQADVSAEAEVGSSNLRFQGACAAVLGVHKHAGWGSSSIGLQVPKQAPAHVNLCHKPATTTDIASTASSADQMTWPWGNQSPYGVYMLHNQHPQAGGSAAAEVGSSNLRFQIARAVVLGVHNLPTSAGAAYACWCLNKHCPCESLPQP